MKRSAASSSSPVVIPGRALERKRRWHLASTGPQAQGGQGGADVAVDVVLGALAVEAPQQAPLVIELDQRLGLLVVDGKPPADGLLLVVVALDQPRAVLVAGVGVLRRVELEVVDVAVLLAYPA